MRRGRGGAVAGGLLIVGVLAGLAAWLKTGPRLAHGNTHGPGGSTDSDIVRVVVASGLDSTAVYADGPAELVDLGAPPGNRVLGRAPRFRAWTLRDREGDVSASGPGLDRPRRFDSLAVVPGDTGTSVFLEGRPYRGRAVLYPVEGHGLVVRSDVPLEPYVAAVVSAELGPAGRGVEEAVKALAVAARTFALRFSGRRDSLRADLLATGADQVYRGRLAERTRVTEWTRSTAGELLLHDGQPVRAYYHAACGGRTARPSDLWERAGADYLRSVPDTAPDGTAYCRLAPLHRWERRWSAGEMAAALASDPDRPLRALSVRERSSTDRVTAVEAVLGSTAENDGIDTLVVERDGLLTLFPAGEPGLPSTRFDLVRSPPDADSVVVVGRGSGHGVGLCQWGAIGRARTGQGYRQILRAYYPGTEVGVPPESGVGTGSAPR